LLYLILNTIPTYIHQRWNLLYGILHNIASRNKESWKGLEDGGIFSQQLYQTLEKAIAVLNIINTLIFLQEGKYPTLITRILNLKPSSTKSPSIGRDVGYSFISRELLWYSFLELVSSVLPTVNIHFIKSWFQSRIAKYISTAKDEKKIAIHHNLGETFNSFKDISREILDNCIICKQSPIILPTAGGCRHFFCYYCIAGHVEATSGGSYQCPKCGAPLTKENLCFHTSFNIR